MEVLAGALTRAIGLVHFPYPSRARSFERPPLHGSLLLRFLELLQLLGAGFRLVAFLVLPVGHAVDDFTRLVIVELDAFLLCRRSIPLRHAVATEVGQIHQVDVLNLRIALQVLDELAKRSGLDAGPGSLVDLLGLGHDANSWLGLGDSVRMISSPFGATAQTCWPNPLEQPRIATFGSGRG